MDILDIRLPYRQDAGGRVPQQIDLAVDLLQRSSDFRRLFRGQLGKHGINQWDLHSMVMPQLLIGGVEPFVGGCVDDDLDSDYWSIGIVAGEKQALEHAAGHRLAVMVGDRFRLAGKVGFGVDVQLKPRARACRRRSSVLGFGGEGNNGYKQRDRKQRRDGQSRGVVSHSAPPFRI